MGTSEAGLLASYWVLLTLNLALTAGRYVIRKNKAGRFYWDDAFHLLAVALFVVYTILLTVVFPTLIQIWRFQAGSSTESPEEVNQTYRKWSSLTIGMTVIWWSCIYAVKAAFLFLYRQLFGVSTKFKRLWWAIAVFNMITFIPCMASVAGKCGLHFFNVPDIERCPHGPGSFQTSIFIYSCVLNVVSDLSVLALALYMLKGLQIRLAQKLGLAAVFSIVLGVIAADIVRTVFSTTNKSVIDIATLQFLELSFAVKTSCLPTYRALFVSRKKSSGPSRYQDPEHHQQAPLTAPYPSASPAANNNSNNHAPSDSTSVNSSYPAQSADFPLPSGTPSSHKALADEFEMGEI
ncbi:hypothetical protein MMC20_004799 [Loxospora ochrophaea]|nr:hypothetical protein [Loxospora ochrophaea]